MAAKEKKQTIVIKKITIAAAGGHGGSWKVAFADFMTAMMAFFLVMWLVGQSEEVKKNVSDYFSTPSIIEYNFSNFGVELTLEKLFLDLVNEPLKAFEQFVKPADKTPNIMDMGMKKIQVQYLADKIGEFAKDVQITSDEITFDIPADILFKKNSADPASDFVDVMEKVREIVEGLKDTDIYVTSEAHYLSGANTTIVKNLAEQRLDFILNKVEQGIMHESVDLLGKTTMQKIIDTSKKRDNRSYIKFRIQQKAKPKVRESASVTTESKSHAEAKVTPTERSQQVDEHGEPADVYNNFVEKLTRKAEGLNNK